MLGCFWAMNGLGERPANYAMFTLCKQNNVKFLKEIEGLRSMGRNRLLVLEAPKP